MIWVGFLEFELCSINSYMDNVNEIRRLIVLLETSLSGNGNTVTAYHGTRARFTRIDVRYGAFFSDSLSVARSYAGHGGRVIKAEIDLSNALRWDERISAEFQDFVIHCHRNEEYPVDAEAGVLRFNKKTMSDGDMEEYIGYLLREHPGRLSWHEIDPLNGFVKAFIADEHDCDVVIRDHESGDGMMAGLEYIVFSESRIHVLEDNDVQV